jgi:hypothetical protein
MSTLDEGYVAADRVNEVASFAAGLARPGRVLLHAGATRGRLEPMRLIAHELTHVVQFDLAGGDGRADQWLAEGPLCIVRTCVPVTMDWR